MDDQPDGLPLASAPSEGGGFATTLRAAITELDLPLDRLRHRLAARGVTVSTATLSHWQTGRSAPHRGRSLHVVTALESALDLAAGSLVSLVPDPRPRGRGTRLRPASDDDRILDPVFDAITRAARALGVVFDDRIRIVTVHQLLEVGPDRVVRSHTVRAVLRAAVAGVDRFVVYYRDDADDDDLPRVVPRLGCRIGGTVHDRSTGGSLTVHELVLPATLSAGERHLVEYEVLHAPVVDTTCDLRMVHPVREAVIAVRFSPDAPPSSVTRRTWQEGVVVEVPVRLDDHTAVAIRHDVDPTYLGVFWTWPD